MTLDENKLILIDDIECGFDFNEDKPNKRIKIPKYYQRNPHPPEFNYLCAEFNECVLKVKGIKGNYCIYDSVLEVNLGEKLI